MPAEVKNSIYGYALEGHDWIFDYKGNAEKRPKNALSLLSVCREINWEASTIPFQVNKFGFRDGIALEKFFLLRTPEQRQSLKMLEFHTEFMAYLDDNASRWYVPFADDSWTTHISVYPELVSLKKIHVTFTYGHNAGEGDATILGQTSVRAIQEMVPEVSVTSEITLGPAMAIVKPEHIAFIREWLYLDLDERPKEDWAVFWRTFFALRRG
jgi:hypothetical protein